LTLPSPSSAGIHKFVPEHHVHSNRAAETAVVNAQRPRWNLSPKPEAPLPGGGAFASPADVNWGALAALSDAFGAHALDGGVAGMPLFCGTWLLPSRSDCFPRLCV
jgi:hypothetical protein